MYLIQKLNSKIIYAGFLALLLCGISCNDPSKVGSELIGEDGFEVVFSDTATLEATIIPGLDSIQTNGEGLATSDIFLGGLNDPFFGTKNFDAYFQSSIGSVPPGLYNYETAQFVDIDSIVLVLRIDTTFFYGDREAEHEIQVFEIDQDFEEELELYTEDILNVKMDPISPIQTIVPQFETFIERFNGDSSTTGPSIRITLNNDFGQRIINDTSAVKKDSSFLNFLDGLKVVSNPSSSSVISLDLAITQLSDIGNKMLLYYSDDGSPGVYSFPIGGLRHHNVVKDFSGTPLESSFNNTEFSDSLIFLEGFGTAEAEITLPNANFANYGNVLIKKAELEVTIADLDGDDLELYSQIPLLGIQVLDDNGEKALVRDAVFAEGAGQLQEYFGGDVREELDDNDEVIRRYYVFNISSYFIDLIENNSIEINKIYLGALVPRLTPGRGTIYGPGHSTFPMKLNVTYTVPN